MHLPLQIIAAIGGTFAPGVASIFLFYLVLCGILARVAIGIYQAIVFPIFAFFDRIRFGKNLNNFKKKKEYIRTYNTLLENEIYIWMFFQFAIFLILLIALYIKYESFAWEILLLIFILPAILSTLIRTRLFVLIKFRNFKKRIKYRHNFRLDVGSALFTTITSVLVVISFTLGSLRMSMLRNAQPQQFSSSSFSGYANLLCSWGNSSLIYEKNGKNERYIYITENFSLGIESKEKSFPKLKTK